MVMLWKGQNVDEMSKEELIEALREMGAVNERAIRAEYLLNIASIPDGENGKCH